MGVHYRLAFRRKRNQCPSERVRIWVTKKTTHTHGLQADQRVVPDARVVDDALRGARDERPERAHIGFIVCNEA